MTPDELRDATCVACPGQCLPLGAFDVAARPSPTIPFDHDAGWRADTATGAPTCVHPFRCGLPPGRYRSAGEPLPATPPAPPPPPDLPLPDDPTLLEAWVIAVVRATPPERLPAALRTAETLATTRFPPSVVVTTLRQVLSRELAG